MPGWSETAKQSDRGRDDGAWCVGFYRGAAPWRREMSTERRSDCRLLSKASPCKIAASQSTSQRPIAKSGNVSRYPLMVGVRTDALSFRSGSPWPKAFAAQRMNQPLQPQRS
jgi:hypothetical protein